DAQALIGLHARALALDDLHVHDERVAGREIRDFLAGGQLGDLFLFDLFQQVHGLSPAAAPRAGRSGGRVKWVGGVLLESFRLVPRPSHATFVIPGRPAGPGPGSITTDSDYGFRARRYAAPRNDRIIVCAPPKGPDGAVG